MAFNPDPLLAAAIAGVPSWQGREVRTVPIHAGITNRNFRVDVGGGSFVVRIPGPNTSLLGIDRRAEHEMACAAAAAGAGPEVFAYLEATQVLITHFVEGKSVTEDELQQEETLSMVVNSLKRIHLCPPMQARFPVFRVVDDYIGLAATRGISPHPCLLELRAKASAIESAFRRNSPNTCPCHNDLLNSNLLRGKDRVWLVDYEYAGMGDPFFDLGNLSINNGFRPESDERLLRLYCGTTTDGARARLQLMRIVSDLRESAWGLVQQGISSLDYDYRDYTERHATRGLCSASVAQFSEWLGAV